MAGFAEAGTGVGAGAGITGGDPPAGRGTPAGTPEEMARRRLLAHRERQPPLPIVDPQQAAKQAAFVRRVFGRPATPTPKLGCPVSRRRPWRCSARSIR